MSGDKFTYVSLFAGCGGSSLGYKMAGGRCLAAIDFDKTCEKTYKKNFPGILFIRKDIQKIDITSLMKEIDLHQGELDILDSSPPCQGFSMSGKRIVSDPRNSLGWSVVKFAKEMRPKAFLFENVEGMAMGDMRGILKMLFKDFSALGYKVKVRVMNSAYHGVPQSRRRLIMVGIRNDIKRNFKFPKRLKKVITAGKAIGGMDISAEEVVFPEGKLKEIVPKLRWGEGGESYIKNTYFNTRRLHPSKPSCTILAYISPSRAGILHWDEDRFLTIKELKRICSFPDDFQLEGSFKKQWGQLGNAVMPMFLKPIAEAIYKVL